VIERLPDVYFFKKMEKTLVFIDDGFLSRLNKSLGQGKYLKYDTILFAENIANNHKLECEHVFFYTAPPFQSNPPTKEENSRKEGYDKFVNKLKQNKKITVQAGRCQKIKDGGGHIKYKQKGVDTLLTMDLGSFKLDYPEINKIILVACDSDFVPIIDKLKSKGIEVILYTYFERERGARFATSNHLLNACSHHHKISKSDFDKASKQN
jgi:uncharacterized LabA/DUF88 family protein